MAKRKVGSKAWWKAEHEKPDPVLENKAFKYKSSSYRQPEYGKTEYFQKGEDGKFSYSEKYIPVKGAIEKREDVTYVPVAESFNKETGERRPPPVRKTKVEVEDPEVKTPNQTDTSNEPKSYLQVRELWTANNQTAPADLERWVTSGGATKEGNHWKRKKDNVTVIYNKDDRSFSIDLNTDDSSSDGNNGGLGPEP